MAVVAAVFVVPFHGVSFLSWIMTSYVDPDMLGWVCSLSPSLVSSQISRANIYSFFTCPANSEYVSWIMTYASANCWSRNGDVDSGYSSGRHKVSVANGSGGHIHGSAGCVEVSDRKSKT